MASPKGNLNLNSSSEALGGPFNSAVKEELKRRKKIVSKRTGRTNEELLELNSQNAWVRLTSAVDSLYTVEQSPLQGEGPLNTTEVGDASMAGRNILSGGTFNPMMTRGILNADNPAYIKDQNLGYRPKAGITDFSVTPKNLYGTLRIASVKFTVPSLDQFNEIEQLFLRPGFSALLEWGHSFYVDEDGTINEPQTFTNNFLRKNHLGSTTIAKELEQFKITNSRNYDAMHGIIKNFSWSLKPDGSYECSVDLVSQGEVLESLQTNVLASTDCDDLDEDIKKAKKENALKELEGKLSYVEKKLLSIILLDEENESVDTLVLEFSTMKEKEHKNVKKRRKYIRLNTLLDIINKGYMLKEGNSSSTEFLTKFSTFEKNTDSEISDYDRFLTFFEHSSGNPYKFVLPKQQFYNKNKSSKNITAQIRSLSSSKVPTINPFAIDSKIYQKEKQNTNIENGESVILNIWVSCDFILGLLKNHKEQIGEENKKSAFDLVKEIITHLDGCLGGINSFDITYNEDTLKYHIVDRRTIPYTDKITSIDVFGVGDESQNGETGALVEDLNLTSKLSNKITTMIAVSAQASSIDAGGKDMQALQQWNTGLTDRHRKNNIYTIKECPTSEETKKDEIVLYGLTEKEIEKYNEFISKVNAQGTRIQSSAATIPQGRLLTGIINTFFPIKIDDEEIIDFLTLHSKVMRARLNELLVEGDSKQVPGLIPFELSFTFKGISGIKIGQAFLLRNEAILPERYRGIVGFIVTGVEHSIKSGRWVTNIKSQMYITQAGYSDKQKTKLKNRKDSIVSSRKPTNDLPPVPARDREFYLGLDYSNPLGKGAVLRTRNDETGGGTYLASRGLRLHLGWDILAQPNFSVYSPIEGKVYRIDVWTEPKHSPVALTAIKVLGTGKYLGQVWRLGYTVLDPNISEGQLVSSGQRIGKVLNMAKAYSGSMKNHLHVDVKRSTTSFAGLDPSTLKYR